MSVCTVYAVCLRYHDTVMRSFLTSEFVEMLQVLGSTRSRCLTGINREAVSVFTCGMERGRIRT